MKLADYDKVGPILERFEESKRNKELLEKHQTGTAGIRVGQVNLNFSKKHSDEIRNLILCLIEEEQITRVNKLRELGVEV